MGKFGLIMAQNYANLCLRICYKDFFLKFCNMIGYNKYIKLTQCEFPPKFFFGANGQFSLSQNLIQKLSKLISQELL